MAKEKAAFSDGSLSADATKALQGFAERAGKLISERAEINDDLGEVMNEARDSGFDAKILRKAIKVVMTDNTKAKSEQDMIDTYVSAIEQLPLFQAAAKAANTAAGAAIPATH
jgi:uncharacterized protein (UPF0335 family)